LALRIGKDERELLDAAAQERGVSLGSFVREAALAAAQADLEPAVDDPEADELPQQATTAVVAEVEDAPTRPSLLRRAFRSAEGDEDDEEDADPYAVWRRPVWRDTGVTPEEAHRHSNVERWPSRPKD
jgi:uncharacterized protein (DUF1778 family)